MQATPEFIGPYKIVRELGRGAMGTVYLGFQESLGRDLAIKVMAPEFVRDQEFVERFRREGRIAAKLRHSHIVQVYDFGDRDGAYYIAMEYLGSRTLKDLVREKGRLSVEEAVRLCDQLLDALEHAHSQGIVHRDIKPANVMVTDQGDAALTDFSIAHMKSASKLTQTGSVLGTPEYMAPEQFEGKSDARSDLYSTGVILYEMLTGFSPFHAETIAEVMKKQLFVAPDPPAVVDFTIPEALSQVVVKCLAKEPEGRCQNAADMRKALREAVSTSRPVGTQAPTVSSAAPVGPKSADPVTLRSCPVCNKPVQQQRFCPGCGHDMSRPARPAAAATAPAATAAPAAPPLKPPPPARLDLRPSESLTGKSSAPPAPAGPPAPEPRPEPVTRAEKPQVSLEPPRVIESMAVSAGAPLSSTPPVPKGWALFTFLEEQGFTALVTAAVGSFLMAVPYGLSVTPATASLALGSLLGMLCAIPCSLLFCVFLFFRRASPWMVLRPLLVVGVMVICLAIVIKIMAEKGMAT